MFLSDECSLLRAEGFSCGLNALCRVLGIAFFYLKNIKFLAAVNIFQFLVIKTLDPDWIRIRIGIQPKIPT